MEDLIKKTVEIIRGEIEERDIRILKILLFGSRARGNFNVDSDWDFFVVIEREISREEMWDIILKIKRKLAKLRIPNDVIIASERSIEEKSKDVGDIVYYALKEGIEV
jgi:predicted nucleotidyltransferase